MQKNKYAWHLSDLANIEQNGVKVMTTFACGGGSSMGYKLAGCTILAANDIDPKMTEQVARAVCEQWLGVDYGTTAKNT